MDNYNSFTGCLATNCVRRIVGKKVRANYEIEDTCRYAKLDVCPHKRTFVQKREHEPRKASQAKT